MEWFSILFPTRAKHPSTPKPPCFKLASMGDDTSYGKRSRPALPPSPRAVAGAPGIPWGLAPVTANLLDKGLDVMNRSFGETLIR